MATGWQRTHERMRNRNNPYATSEFPDMQRSISASVDFNALWGSDIAGVIVAGGNEYDLDALQQKLSLGEPGLRERFVGDGEDAFEVADWIANQSQWHDERRIIVVFENADDWYEGVRAELQYMDYAWTLIVLDGDSKVWDDLS